jgi:V/A-type H+-transporting ATPase subunit I
MLLSSVVIGFFHVSLGFILGFINELRHHNFKHALYSKMSFLLILWGGVIALVSVVGLLPEFTKLLGIVVLLIGLTLAVLGEGIVGILEFPTVFSNVISYARIGAIGLSDYGLAFTVNFIAFNLIGLEGIMAIVSISILLIGHLTVFTLGIIGTGINSLRLQYVEFFTKFVHGGGTLYDPFGYNRKYTKENEVQP